MLHALLFNIGSLIITMFITITYFTSISKDNRILRQKLFALLITIGLVAMIGDILEVVFFVAELKIPLILSWKLHWLASYAFFIMFYYYFRAFMGIDKIETWKDVYIDKKIFSSKNIYLIYSFILYAFALIIVKVPEIGSKFDFIPDQYNIYTIMILISYTIFIIDLIIRYQKVKKKNEKNKALILLVSISGIGGCVVLQILLDDFATLGLGIFMSIMLIYFLIENADLLIASELKQLQNNIERSSNAKLDFLYNMSHDIRSPMNAIVELSKTLRKVDEFNEEAIRNDIRSIKFSCNNLVDIVNNILDINKIASGNETLQLKEYNLNKLLADLPYVIETRIGSRPIKLEFDIDQNIASKMIGDTTKIYRVIMNILTNSVKYTEVGKIRMTIKGNIDGDTQNLHIKISDTGYGIKKEDFDKMFTKFNRLDDATDNAIEGTGLGLVITKKYVDSMGGKIWFESEYGAGTIFYIDLPQKIVDKTPLSEAVDSSENKKIEVCDCTNSRVLIVDDNALNIKVTKKILEKYNIEVDTVKSGKDCIYKIKSGQKYDLILLDDVLPDLGGMEVVHVVKNIQGFDIPPVIAYTANVMNGIKEEYLKSGFDDYMPKPLDIHQFDGIIKRYCYKQKNGE